MAMEDVTGIFLRKEVEELRKQGESWGLNKEEIDEAILRALGERSPSASKDASKTKSKKRSCVSRCVQLAGLIILLPILLYTGVSLMAMIKPSFGLYIGQMTADLQYPLQRVVRLISLPLHNFMDLSAFSAWECMVDNPLYVPEKPDCTICQGLKKIATRSSTNLTKAAFKKRFYDTAFPVKVRDMPGYGDVGHSFEKFMEFYHANQADLEQGACEFKINGVVNESVKSLADVLKNWDHYMPAGNIIGWKVCYGQGLRSLRALFPRPYCIHSEGALDKSMYLLQPAIDATDSSTEQVLISETAHGTFDNVWMAQVTGSTVVNLLPVEHCKDKCERFEFTLEQGDVFFFSQYAWTASFHNVANEPAMVFTSSFA